MKKLLFIALITLNGFTSFGQNSFQTSNFSADCNSDFWTITVDGHIQQWSLRSRIISRGDTILSGGGQSLSFCGKIDSPTFFTDNWKPGEIGIDYFDPDSGWVNIPTLNHVQDNGGHLSDQYYTVVGGVIQYVNYWDGIKLRVIDSLPGEFFAGIFDIGVDTSGHAWIFTASSPGTAVDSLKVYDKSGKINSFPIKFNMQGYGSFFLNDTLYLGTHKDSIFPVIINGRTAQLGIGIPFPRKNFTDMASCQTTGLTSFIANYLTQRIKIFPNPTVDIVRIVIPNKSNESITISIHNELGQEVLKKVMKIENGEQSVLLSTSQLNPGVYIVIASLGDKKWVKKLLKY